MNVTKTAKTRIEDWQDRQRYLKSLASKHPRIALQIKLLDFLISRYGDSEVAQQPVRVSFQRKFQWNDRRITVHHHLGRGKVAGVQNQEDAEHRMAVLVQRMISDERREDERSEPPKVRVAPRTPVVYNNTDWQIKLGWNVDGAIREALANYPILSETCLKNLSARLSDVTYDDKSALYLFLKCENRNILAWTVRIWRERVVQGRPTGLITETLEARLLATDSHSRDAELIRERLADDNAQVRMAACRMIAKMGDLDDVTLLSDLLALPPSSDEAPNERDALLAAMKSIAERLG